MNTLLQKIKDEIPLSINEFSYIKDQEIYIPFLEIGIECLVRNISDINLFFETILKLVSIGIVDIPEMSDALGISYEISKEAIVDMIADDYISVAENRIKITNKGKAALQTKKQIALKKKNINRVFIDLITGEIHNGSDVNACTVGKRAVCLEGEIKVDKSFLDSKYHQINEVFQKQQEEDSVFERRAITKELYKIINIYYQNLMYVKKKLSIYRNYVSDDFLLNMSSDQNDQYLDCLYKQLKSDIHPSLDNFFERDRSFIRKTLDFKYLLDVNRKKATDKAIAELNAREHMQDVDISFFEADRYSIYENEYMEYFVSDKAFRFEKVIIITNRVGSILTPTVFQEILRISAEKKVYLLFDANEYNAESTIKHFLGEKRKNIYVFPTENIDSSTLLLFPYVMFNLQEYVLKAFNRHISFKVSHITFRLDAENRYVKELFTKHDLNTVIGI